MVDLRRKYTQTIISSLVIQQYDKLFHPKLRSCMHGTRSCVVVSVTYLGKSIHSSLLACGNSYLRNINNISKNSQNRRSDKKYNRVFDTYKTFWCHMGIIYMQQQLTQTWLQCVNIHHPNMYCHTGNVCWVVVIISHVLIFQTKNQIGIIPTHIVQYVFIFIT